MTKTHLAYLFRELDEISIVGCIGGRQKVSNEEDHKDQLNRGSDGVILVAGLDVADEHGRAGNLLESVRDSIKRLKGNLLGIVKLHLARAGRSGRVGRKLRIGDCDSLEDGNAPDVEEIGWYLPFRCNHVNAPWDAPRRNFRIGG